jgi:transcriptional regulator with XRE-family HTH domain
MLTVGDIIRSLRKSKNLNQDQLAELANLNRVTVAKYESGKVEPGAQALNRLADALGVTVDEILGRNKDTAPEETDVDLLSCLPKTVEQLSPVEMRLLGLYRSMNQQGRDMLLASAESFSINPVYQKDTQSGAI